MFKPYKNSLFLTIFLSLLLAGGFAYALEITYPNIPFYPDINNCTGNDCMAKFISYWFGFGIMLAGVIALISLIVASVQLIASAGNPGVQGDARDRIRGALLGMVLLVSSFIIMRTINPTLVTPSLTPLGEVAGVFYTNGEGGETKPAPISESDTANVPEGFQTIIYKCAEGGFSPNLYVWKFPQKNFIGNNNWYDGVGVTEISCGENTDIGGAGSFKMAFKTPGVYYFLGDNCTGYMSGPSLSDEAQITDPFKNNIKSIRVINDSSNIFGFIAHNGDVNSGSECGEPYVAGPWINNNCFSINIPVSSINIFRWNSEAKSSGNGVSFYSKPWGKESRTPGDQAGFYNLGFDKIQEVLGGGEGMWGTAPENMIFSYENVNVPEAYKLSCQNFDACSGSIKIQGNYLVVLYTGYTENPGIYCQISRVDTPNLDATEFKGSGKNLKWVNVIPIK